MTFSGKDLGATFIIAAMIGLWFGYGLANRTIRTNAIDQNCAHYDARTGEFVWGQP